MTLRIGIVGTGFAKRVQLPGLRLVPDVEVTAISSGQRANADAVAREFGIPHVFDDGVELARSGRADLVIVSSTPVSHARYAVAAVRYILGSVAHGVIVDSGSATLTREQPPYAVHVKGNGAEVAIPGRRSVELTADHVPLERDTVNCVVQL